MAIGCYAARGAGKLGGAVACRSAFRRRGGGEKKIYDACDALWATNVLRLLYERGVIIWGDFFLSSRKATAAVHLVGLGCGLLLTRMRVDQAMVS